MVIVQPGGSTFDVASFIPLCGSIASALAVIGTRLAKNERPETTLFYSAVTGFAVISVLAGFTWQTPTWNQVAIGGIVGFFATLASLMQIFAYRNAPASLLAPFSYTQLVWAAALGYLAFGTIPGPSMLLGAAIIAASGIYTAWREAVRAPRLTTRAEKTWIFSVAAPLQGCRPCCMVRHNSRHGLRER